MWFINESIERLLMLMDGKFYTLDDVNIQGPLKGEEYVTFTKEIINRRLPYFKSVDVCLLSINRFLSFQNILSAAVIERWFLIQDELEIVNQVILYNLADTGITKDLKCAYLIESCESLAEIVSRYEVFFISLFESGRRPILKSCIDAVISMFGYDVFLEEYRANKERFLSCLVNSRVRIMHIKPHQNNLFLDGPQSTIYLIKFSYLYRIVLLSLIGIDYSIYKDKVIAATEYWNQYKINNCGVVAEFISHL